MLVSEIGTLVALTVASAFCSSSEVAFFSLSNERIKRFFVSKNPKERAISAILKKSTSLLVTIFMLNTIVNILLQNSASNIFDQVEEPSWLLKVGVPLFIVLVFGELIPKYFAFVYNEVLARLYVQTLSFLQWLLTPFRIAVTKISTFFSRTLFFFLKPEPALSKDELEHILESSEGKGLVHRDETACILGVMTLDTKQVRELMLPKIQMPVFDSSEPISKLIHLFSLDLLSEIPVTEKDSERILGVIDATTFFIHRPKITDINSLLPHLRRPLFVPETTSAKALLETFSEKDLGFALVVDEYGQMTGAITELDLVEQITKRKEENRADTMHFKRVAKDAIVADGVLSLDDISDLFDVELKSAYSQVTIGGYLTEKLGEIPKSGTTYSDEALFFRIISQDPTKITKVYIQKR